MTIMLLLWLIMTTKVIQAAELSFGLLNGGSEFFQPIETGWLSQCNKLGVKCHYRVSPSGPCEESRTQIIHEFLSLNVSGIAFKPCSDGDNMTSLVDKAWQLGVPMVTFDSDIPSSKRVAYVGTDNYFMGRTMARLLRQLNPNGGTFAIVAEKDGRSEGFRDEISRYNGRDNRPKWHEIDYDYTNPPDFGSAGEIFEFQLERSARSNPTAIVTLKQSPMKGNWTGFVDEHRERDITHIGVDGADFQLDYLSRGYVDGLVGQLPHEIGVVSLNVLIEWVQNKRTDKEFYPTNLVAYNLIPLELPDLDVDQNLLGNLKYIGFVCYAIVALASIGCVVWTLYNRIQPVVRAAQPFFLVMVACGVLVMSSSLIPLSFDDGGDPLEMSQTRRVGICMSTPWLAFVGFTVTFSALFSKTLRVNRLFRAKIQHARIQVSEKDVLPTFAVLLTCNIAVLVCWTVLDPLTYVRQEHEGTDYWNRVISTYGACRSDNVVAYVVPLAVLNFCAVAQAAWQALQARNIESEFSEAKYIGLTVASLFQAFLTGIPVVVVVREMPKSYYVILSLMIFLLCMAVLLLIFLPKVSMQRDYAGKSEAQQKRMIEHKIQRSSAEIKRKSREFDWSDQGSSFGFQGQGSGEQEKKIKWQEGTNISYPAKPSRVKSENLSSLSSGVSKEMIVEQSSSSARPESANEDSVNSATCGAIPAEKDMQLPSCEVPDKLTMNSCRREDPDFGDKDTTSTLLGTDPEANLNLHPDTLSSPAKDSGSDV